MDAVLEKNDAETGLLAKYTECVRVLQEGVEEMKKEVERQPFADKAEEIRYFKYQAPKIHGRLFFFMKLVQIESCRQYYSRGRFDELLTGELRESELFLEKHAAICSYYYKGDVFWDDFLFTRRGRGEWSAEEVGAFIDEHFTLGAYWVSGINANTQLRNWVLAEMEEGRLPAEGARPKNLHKLVWSANKVDLVELGWSLQLQGCFNDGKATLKEVMEWLSENLGVDLRNYNVTKGEIAMRKISRTKFALHGVGAGGVDLPNTQGSWPGGSGDDPGDLGQDILSMSLPANASRNTVQSPHPNQGSCN